MRNFRTKVNNTAPLATGILDAAEDNIRFEELENAVTAGGITLDGPDGPDSNKTMLAESMTRHASGALWCADGGSANAYVLTMGGSFVAPRALFEGLTVRFRAGNANTGASTANAFGLGVKPILDHTQATLTSGSIQTRIVELIYRPSVGAAGAWILPAWANANQVGQTPEITNVVSGEGVEIDATPAANLNFPGLDNDSDPQDDDLFAFFDDADSQHKNITFAQLLTAIGDGGGGGGGTPNGWRIAGLKFITTTSTYTKPDGVSQALVIAIGGGGGGARSSNPVDQSFTGAEGGAAGGGGGGASITLADISAVSTVSCTIGAGGIAPTTSIGGAGGSTSFGSLCSASGGLPGSSGTPGEGGNGVVGLIKIRGGAGGTGLSTQIAPYAMGGASFLGGGGAQLAITSLTGGPFNGPTTGSVTGALGSGGGSGQAGQPGCIIIVELA